jgi:HPt (histidine-containing phosphotransfer) domain-containing protein
MEQAGQPSMTEALDQLWVKFRPQLDERVDLLEAASEALREGKLSTHQRESANSAAHKLAGVLGTFGLTKGTILAREAEIIYSGEPEIDPDVASHLTEIAEQLRTIIAGRK